MTDLVTLSLPKRKGRDFQPSLTTFYKMMCLKDKAQGKNVFFPSWSFEKPNKNKRKCNRDIFPIWKKFISLSQLFSFICNIMSLKLVKRVYLVCNNNSLYTPQKTNSVASLTWSILQNSRPQKLTKSTSRCNDCWNVKQGVKNRWLFIHISAWFHFLNQKPQK